MGSGRYDCLKAFDVRSAIETKGRHKRNDRASQDVWKAREEPAGLGMNDHEGKLGRGGEGRGGEKQTKRDGNAGEGGSRTSGNECTKRVQCTPGVL